MASHQKGSLIAEGKTKKIWEVEGNPMLVIIENKDDITAFDNPNFTRQFATKAQFATGTTCRAFELLRRTFVPTAFIEQISPTEFVAEKCRMIPLEAVTRRFAVGSCTKRNPQLATPKGEVPHRFHRLRTEFFLKTTKGSLILPDGTVVVEGFNAEKDEEDPLIIDPRDNEKWTLVHSKKPLWDPESFLREIPVPKILPENVSIDDLDSILRDVFLVLEGMWKILGYHFIDLKIEFGITESGEIVVSDVIDNDSWRLRDKNWNELSKEAFRQGEELSEVEKKYGFVSELLLGFNLPEQCIVLWRGSEKDEFPEVAPEISRQVFIRHITASGHKAPLASAERLNELEANFSSGVIIAKVGMSNGLGPMLAARTTWPMISIPATAEKHPEDIWSSLRLPSQVPMATVLSEKNAISLAANILAQKNPILYMVCRKAIENLDL